MHSPFGKGIRRPAETRACPASRAGAGPALIRRRPRTWGCKPRPLPGGGTAAPVVGWPGIRHGNPPQPLPLQEPMG